MIEQAPHQRPCFAGIASCEQRGGFYPAIEHAGFVGWAECYLPDVLQGNAGIGGKSNRCLLRVGPALPEVIAGSQERPRVAWCGCPYARLSPTPVIGQLIDGLD